MRRRPVIIPLLLAVACEAPGGVVTEDGAPFVLPAGAHAYWMRNAVQGGSWGGLLVATRSVSCVTLDVYGSGAPAEVEHGRGVGFFLTWDPDGALDGRALSGCYDGGSGSLDDGTAYSLDARSFAYGDVEEIEPGEVHLCFTPPYGEPPLAEHAYIAIEFEAGWWHGEVVALDCDELTRLTLP
jgi:hypothetical protein